MKNPDARLRPRVVSLKDDPVGKMAKLGRLGLANDRDVRLMAARKWEELYKIAGGKCALDPFADIIDGGRGDNIDTRRLDAVKSLSQAAQRLGMRNENLIYHLLGEGISLEEYLERGGMLTGSAKRRQKAIDTYMQIVRDCLDDLATVFHYRVVAGAARRHTDRFDYLSKFTANPRAYDAARKRQKEGA